MRRVAFAGLCLALAILFAGLGIWQVERRAWKLDLIAKVEGRVHAAPSTLPPRDEWQGDNAYRRVRVTGTFLHDRETLVQALTALGGGWWVLTPLQTQDGIILVNRGYVPDDRRDRATRQAALPTGPVTVTGLMRDPEPGGGFLRSNDPAADRWFSRDVAAIARARQLGATAPFFIDADDTPNTGGYPVGGLTVISFRNNHLSYAVTWFALALLSVAGAVMVLRSGRRR
ncbi:SURF1 family protein [Sphingomonas sp. ABOLG]|uniref:SURF1 family protein n=1 Tax=Sphingomonas sp. ABOLG TaxID=1985880 RepID=UPI000F7E8FEE|nr:SURF1 family protein [Sphingomonas sp. ABOLG]RSV17769.1 SURF1 family protein [Sphingomonas sp. ABOLG]